MCVRIELVESKRGKGTQKKHFGKSIHIFSEKSMLCIHVLQDLRISEDLQRKK